MLGPGWGFLGVFEERGLQEEGKKGREKRKRGNRNHEPARCDQVALPSRLHVREQERHVVQIRLPVRGQLAQDAARRFVNVFLLLSRRSVARTFFRASIVVVVVVVFFDERVPAAGVEEEERRGVQDGGTAGPVGDAGVLALPEGVLGRSGLWEEEQVGGGVEGCEVGGEGGAVGAVGEVGEELVGEAEGVGVVHCGGGRRGAAWLGEVHGCGRRTVL